MDEERRRQILAAIEALEALAAARPKSDPSRGYMLRLLDDIRALLV